MRGGGGGGRSPIVCGYEVGGGTRRWGISDHLLIYLIARGGGGDGRGSLSIAKVPSLGAPPESESAPRDRLQRQGIREGDD